MIKKLLYSTLITRTITTTFKIGYDLGKFNSEVKCLEDTIKFGDECTKNIIGRNTIIDEQNEIINHCREILEYITPELQKQDYQNYKPKNKEI